MASVNEISTVSERKKHSKRSNNIRTPQLIDRVQNIIDDDARKSMRFIAKELHVSEWTIRKVVHEDLQYKSYKKRHML